MYARASAGVCVCGIEVYADSVLRVESYNKWKSITYYVWVARCNVKPYYFTLIPAKLLGITFSVCEAILSQ